MFINSKQHQIKFSTKLLIILLINIFICETILPTREVIAQVPRETVLKHISTSNPFDPVMIKGINLYPKDPLRFDFIVGKGDSKLEGKAFKSQANQLIKYFLAALTIPKDQLWVNLSPYEKNRIIPQALSKTDMGRDLLAQDNF